MGNCAPWGPCPPGGPRARPSSAGRSQRNLTCPVFKRNRFQTENTAVSRCPNLGSRSAYVLIWIKVKRCNLAVGGYSAVRSCAIGPDSHYALVTGRSPLHWEVASLAIYAPPTFYFTNRWRSLSFWPPTGSTFPLSVHRADATKLQSRRLIMEVFIVFPLISFTLVVRDLPLPLRLAFLCL